MDIGYRAPWLASASLRSVRSSSKDRLIRRFSNTDFRSRARVADGRNYRFSARSALVAACTRRAAQLLRRERRQGRVSKTLGLDPPAYLTTAAVRRAGRVLNPNPICSSTCWQYSGRYIFARRFRWAHRCKPLGYDGPRVADFLSARSLCFTPPRAQSAGSCGHRAPASSGPGRRRANPYRREKLGLPRALWHC